MLYQWDNSLSTGHELIDKQHQQLFALINDVLSGISEKKSAEDLKKSLDFLNEYTIKHFFDEEQIQKSCNYPDYENHKKYHEGFKKTVRDLSVRLIMKGHSEELAREVQTQIGDWLVTHIKGQDVKLAAFIRGQR
jgi:hemerythrin